jgi:hypothetical protein
MQWFGMQFPQLRKFIFSIPNGTHLAGDGIARAIKMKKLKDEGFMPGVADLFLMIPRGEYHGMFIEMKAEKGALQTEQKEFLERADNQGYMAVTCYGFIEAKEAVTQYLKGVK